MKAKEALHSGKLYLPGDEEILKEQFECLEKLYDFNQTRPSEFEKRTNLLKEMFGESGNRKAQFHDLWWSSRWGNGDFYRVAGVLAFLFIKECQAAPTVWQFVSYMLERLGM